MKKIVLKSETEKKKNRNQFLIGVILVGLMLLSTAGYALTSKSDTSSSSGQVVSYNGIKFIKNSAYWDFNFNGQNYETLYNPGETREVSISANLGSVNLQNKPIYFVGDDESIGELAKNLNSQVLRIQKACLSENNCSGNYPIKDCSDNVIIIKTPAENETSGISRTNNCIFIVSNSTEQTKYSDAFLFKVLGV